MFKYNWAFLSSFCIFVFEKCPIYLDIAKAAFEPPTPLSNLSCLHVQIQLGIFEQLLSFLSKPIFSLACFSMAGPIVADKEIILRCLHKVIPTNHPSIHPVGQYQFSSPILPGHPRSSNCANFWNILSSPAWKKQTLTKSDIAVSKCLHP